MPKKTNTNPPCPVCGGRTSIKGHLKSGSTRYRCNAKECRKSFTPGATKGGRPRGEEPSKAAMRMRRMRKSMENQAILLSIKPQFAEAILSGAKTFEYRRQVWKNRTARKVYIYASSPVSKVVGHFEIGAIITKPPAELWTQTRHGGGISQEYFGGYFGERPLGNAIQVANPQRMDAMTLFDAFGLARPPQSFMYVEKINE